MYRQSPSRNQRSKGIKVKNVLQICLLLAVCFWLMYQVKHSHDKKKEFEESDAKVSLGRTSGDKLKLGRRDLRPRVEETDSKAETSEEEETTGEEIEENKHDKDESVDQKVEEEEDEAGGRGVETEEHEEVKSDAEIDREQGLVDREEREDGEENETHETDSEEGHDGQMEKESTVDDTDHDADDTSSHEAREEHYKADDASSAVTHEHEHVEDSNELPGSNLEEEKKENNGEETYQGGYRKDLEVEGNEAAGDRHQSNVTASAAEENMLHDSENGSTLNNEVTEGSADHSTNTLTAELMVVNNGLLSENLTKSKPEIGHDLGNVTDTTSGIQNGNPEEANNSTDSAETTDAAEAHSEQFSGLSRNTTDSSASEDPKLEASTEEGNNELEGEKSDSSDGADESSETTSTYNPEEVQEDAIDISDASISTLEKDILKDLDMLPEILTEGTNSEDAAAE